MIFVFVLTFLIELLMVKLITKKEFKDLAFYVFLINLFTWPIANYLFFLNLNFYLIEVGVIMTEALLFAYVVKLERPIIASLAANLVTAAFSVI